jgi:hypothetical protein
MYQYFYFQIFLNKKLKSKFRFILIVVESVDDDNVLVALTVSREKGEIVYKIDSLSNLTTDELEYYLEEIIKGICKWKPNICEETVKTYKGTIRKNKKSQS